MPLSKVDAPDPENTACLDACTQLAPKCRQGCEKQQPQRLASTGRYKVASDCVVDAPLGRDSAPMLRPQSSSAETPTSTSTLVQTVDLEKLPQTDSGAR